MMDEDLHDLFGDDRRLNAAQYETDAAEEATAKAAIGRVLTALPEDVRSQVVRWIVARFGADLASNQHPEPPAAADSAASTTSRSDPTLAVDDLSDLFSPPGDVGELHDVRLKPDTTDTTKSPK